METCRTFCTALLLTAVCAVTGAQPRRGMYDFQFIREDNPWLTSSNASGLSSLQADRTSYVEAFFRKDDGGLVGNNGSDNALQAGLCTESYVRISDRISFFGRMAYKYTHGKNMGGPILLDPSYNPVNFYEDSPETTGAKNKEQYIIGGGISYSFNRKWSIGARIDYEAAYGAKRKDPRFQNDWMDLDITIGGKFSPSEKFSVGADFLFRNTIEKINADIFGVKDKQYFTFIDYGGLFGRREGLAGDTGFIPINASQPMDNLFYGGSVQIEAGEKVKVFNELTFTARDGSYGKKGSSTVLFFEYGGYTLSYSGDLLIRNRAENLHKVHLKAEYESIRTNENIYRRTTPAGSATVIEYFGQNEIQTRTAIKGNLSYTGYLGIENFRAEWEYGINADIDYLSTLTTIYPHYRQSRTACLSAEIYGKKNFTVSDNIFTLGINGEFVMGSGIPKNDGTYSGSSSEQPRSADVYLNRDFEYKTISRAGASLSFRYTRLFKKNFSIYADISDRYVRALKAPEFLGNGFRNSFVFTLGCAF